MMKWWKWLFGERGVRFGRPERMTDAELYEALAVDMEHPIFRAFTEIAARGQADAEDQARNVVGDHAELSYYLGAKWAMESLVDYALAARMEAMKRERERGKS